MNNLKICTLISFTLLTGLMIVGCSSDDKEENSIFMPSHKDKKLVSLTYIDYRIDSTVDDKYDYGFYYDGYGRLNKVDLNWDWYSYESGIHNENISLTYAWRDNVVTESRGNAYILNNECLITSLDGGTVQYDSNNRPVYYMPAYGSDERDIIWNSDKVEYTIDENGDSLFFSYSKDVAKGCNYLLLYNIHGDLSSEEIAIVHPELLGFDFESPLLLQVKHNNSDNTIKNYTYEISGDGYIESIKEVTEETISGKRYTFISGIVTYKWE